MTDFYNYTVGASHDACSESTFELCFDFNCTEAWNQTEKAELITSGNEVVMRFKNDIMYNDTNVYLQRKTRGAVTAVQKFNFTSCGSEVIKNKGVTAQKIRLIVGLNQEKIEFSEEFDKLFSSNSLCPINSFYFVEKIG